MSEPTVIDADFEETGATLKSRVEILEAAYKHLLDGQRNVLEHFREMVAAVTEISEESSEE